ncbi:hypothetical protein [Neptunomonas sp.]|uniref:hypothetical protein n=1 Tax=Neptunomonas sp. TaxID=1971898 RepID=UPI0025EC59BC|nr:hypothetical protein [Neptunomonas sp.]
MNTQNLNQTEIDTGAASIRKHFLENNPVTNPFQSLDSYYDAILGLDIATDRSCSFLFNLRANSFSMRMALSGGLAS